MSRGLILLFVTPIVIALHSARGQAAAPAQIAGCYAVSIGLWSPALEGDTSLHEIPFSVRLDTVRVSSGHGWRLSPNLQHPASKAMPGTPRWQMVAGEDVRLTWSNGATLTVAQLIPVPGKGLVGEAVALSDNRLAPDSAAFWWNSEPPGPRAPAFLERRPCSGRTGSADQPSNAEEGVGTIRPWSADLALATRVAGCYELANGSWQTDSALSRFEPAPRSPIRFELTNIPDPDATRIAAEELRTYFETRSSDLFSTWIRISDTDQTILVSRPLPMAGFDLELTPRGRDLVGTISAFTDAIPPGGTGRTSHAVTARRISCASLRD